VFGIAEHSRPDFQPGMILRLHDAIYWTKVQCCLFYFVSMDVSSCGVVYLLTDANRVQRNSYPR
jgi:hypothetical protein